MKNNPLDIYRGLPKEIYVLSIATLVNCVANFVYPFLALYLTSRLGFSAAEAGRYMTIASCLYVPGSLIGSKIADKYGRKRVMLLSQLAMAFFFALCGFYDGQLSIAYFVLAALFCDGICDPARGALKTDVTNFGNRQASFSLIYLSLNVGFAIGPMVGGLLFSTNPRWLFWGNAIALAASTIPVFLMVKESKPDKEAIEQSKRGNAIDKAEDGGLLKALLTRPRLLIFALAMSFFTFGYSAVGFGLPLFINNLFSAKGPATYGRLMGFTGIIVVVGNPIVISLTKRRDPLSNVMRAGLLFATGFLPFIWSKALWQLYLCSFVFTVGEVLWVNNEHYYVANHTPISHRARFNAIMPIIEGTGRALAPMAGGAIIDSFSMDWLWLGAVASMLVGVCIVCILHGKERQPHQAF